MASTTRLWAMSLPAVVRRLSLPALLRGLPSSMLVEAMKDGYIVLGRVRGAPVRVHISAPLGAVMFTGFTFSPLLWVGFILLVILHELGHAAVVVRLGYRVEGVRVHAFGGDCQWSGDATRLEIAAIFWGGVLAQAALWVAVSVYVLVFGYPSTPVAAAFVHTSTSTNAAMIVFNLLPVPPLDGSRAWTFFPLWWRAKREEWDYQRMRRRPKDPAQWFPKGQPKTVRKEVAKEVASNGDDEPLAPMPPEVREVLERVAREVDREERTKRGR